MNGTKAVFKTSSEANQPTKPQKKACPPDHLKKYKPPLVGVNFPSKASLLNESSSTTQVATSHSTSDSSLSKSDEEKSPLTYWRFAHYSDAEKIKDLIENSDFVMNDLFGEPDIYNLIELSNFAIVQFNKKKELVSFISFFCYPCIPAVPSFEWYPWLINNYKLKDVTPRNAFFVHYMVWKTEYYYDFLKLALETAFLENSYCLNILIMKPPKVKLPKILSEYFIHVLPKDADFYNCDCNSLQTALVCMRYSIMERLKIRLAIVEDHDDLMPIAEQHNSRLRELYGDYCMAEIIEYPGTPNRKTLVCESRGYAVGFMTLNTAIDYELLNSQFDLTLFHGLRKQTDDDKMAEDLDKDEGATLFVPKEVDPFVDVVNGETMLKFLNYRPSLCVSEEQLSASEERSEEYSILTYNAINISMADFIYETLNLKLAPKFSAHALSNQALKTIPEEPSKHSILSDDEVCFSKSESTESNVKSEVSLVSLQHFNLPIYHGPPNAFCIEFFAMDKNFDDRLCQDFLEAAFELFQDLEYCIFTCPADTPTFPLVEFFTRVIPRPLRRFRQELYVCHRSSAFISFMRVRRTLKPDLEEIYVLLKGIHNNEFIFADIVNSCYFEDSAFQSFVLICNDSIIGVAVLCNECGMEYLAHHYHVSDLIDFESNSIEKHAIVKHLVVSPIFHCHSRFFLRDIMRMADITCLYRCLYEESQPGWNRFSLITILSQFMPVKPRRMVTYHVPSLEPNIPPEYFRETEAAFSLYHVNPKICEMKMITCNKSLVIIGASKTTYSFLEELLFGGLGSYVSYNNITVVAPHGMGTELPSHPARDIMFPYRGKFNRYYKMQLSLKTYVNLVYGVMTQINRVDKYVVINNESILPYDYLVLLCGRQFGMPVPLVQSNSTQVCRRHTRPRGTLFRYLYHLQPEEAATKSVYPSNAFLINTVVDATNAFISLQYMLQLRRGFRADEKIIVYGHYINVYLCIQALLKYGIPPRMIALVEPFPMGTHSISCFDDGNIDKAVTKSLSQLEIDHYKGYVLYDWELCKNNQIKTATFHSEHRKIVIKCLAMFPYEKKVVSDVTFRAINEASLVYDGKLVINSRFQTNDPCIYSAGGLTKYQRKYYARNKNHRNYSSEEVGKNLAEVFKNEINPTLSPSNKTNSLDVVPEMTEPVVLSGELPGNWHFLKIRKPGTKVDEETRATIKEFGDTLITGDCEMSQGRGYFKLILDQYGFVSGITCFSKERIDLTNLETLYGKHEKLLNNLVLRFDLGMITDFFSYFREPWVYAIYHDRFGLVMERNHELFETENLGNGEKFIDSVVDLLEENNWQKLPKEKMTIIKKKFENSHIKGEIVENIMEFLTYFDEPFPMYATPRILRVLLHDANTSLLHKVPACTRPIIKIDN